MLSLTAMNPREFWYYIGLYLLFNLVLTLFNKAVLDNFPYPYTLTAVHAAANVIGSTIARLYGLYVGLLSFIEDFIE